MVDLSNLEVELRKHQSILGPMFSEISRREDALAIDLSVLNENLAKLPNQDTLALTRYVEETLRAEKKSVAFGGYGEERGWYQRSSLFEGDAIPRTIHIGLDIWIPAGTSVHSPLAGKIHSFKNNFGFGDYGPTVIVQHELSGMSFCILYGHLSLESLDLRDVGEVIEKGERVGWIGDSAINGSWPPHLHLQLIDAPMNDFEGDFPGVVSKSDKEKYMRRCPDPSILIFS